MKVTRKPEATEREQRLIDQAGRTAELFKQVSPESPLRQRMLDRYDRIVDELGYDPIS
ncbi:hypothetical protein [Micromonospora sp. HUAS LYJ1]|uniref:hypothetical protein n=1 Tax=Micromonospora sp. HUAS LYJ1 TaxID=3061626 RepID=UPI0026735BBD|nr:hypothetical protein [Micromonospora sp. HUAS LYJ1]WKU08022.1 hypothetical protein Q2K16_13820 [Micromonospora sp. HUAS LYJ1]